MTYQIAHSHEFPFELGRVPKKVRGAYSSLALPLLNSAPERADPPRVKPLSGFRDLWRLRISDDYRLVYRVDRAQRLVTLLMIDRRSTIYDRLGTAANGTPGIRIIAKASDLLERQPTAGEIGNACMQFAAGEQPARPLPDARLPVELDSDLLTQWTIPAEFHAVLLTAKTEAQLLALDSSVPSSILERVMNAIWPPVLEEVVQKPCRLAEDPIRVERAADGELSLESFMLSLDSEQKTFVSRFESRDPQGPWLIKGGPGSGKSTVAIYCARAIVGQSRAMKGAPQRLRVLFTTYTKSLVSASRHLLRSLARDDDMTEVDVRNIDQLAYGLLSPDQQRISIAKQADLNAAVTHALQVVRTSGAGSSFDVGDGDYLLDEIDWVMIGQGLRSLGDYLAADRSGRGRPFGAVQRRELWLVYEEFRRWLRARQLCMFSERLVMACDRATPHFDYVFVDEAQDLKPIALRCCVKLCRSPGRIFLAADPNQTIYGSGMSWSTVSSALCFSGRARILRRNYRTTREIWRAVQQLAPAGSAADSETLEAEPVYSGPWPGFTGVRGPSSLRRALNDYLFEALRSERLAPGCAAVLCPTNRALEEVELMIDSSLRPKAMSSAEVDLSHPGVKVMTMHAAKGLQFPVVAIVGLTQGQLPSPPSSEAIGGDHLIRQQRLLFVACTRAIRRLRLFGSNTRRSQFLDSITDEHWDLAEL